MWAARQVKTVPLKRAKRTKGVVNSPFSGLGFSAAGHFNVWRHF
jgi:hypothetical protein